MDTICQALDLVGFVSDMVMLHMRLVPTVEAQARSGVSIPCDVLSQALHSDERMAALSDAVLLHFGHDRRDDITDSLEKNTQAQAPMCVASHRE
jgi:hypothetical protein